MRLPDYVMECLEALENAGYAAYAVGGCVRDLCLGRQPHDYDLCTAALPHEIQTVFRHRPLVLAGLKHGTVGVLTQGGVVEITTFRTEGAYTDNRHPDSVCFVPEIEKDLARRDFTVNAMAWSPRRGFADPFGGRQDLEHKIPGGFPADPPGCSVCSALSACGGTGNGRGHVPPGGAHGKPGPGARV